MKLVQVNFFVVAVHAVLCAQYSWQLRSDVIKNCLTTEFAHADQTWLC
jgi:hypothetical protein